MTPPKIYTVTSKDSTVRIKVQRFSDGQVIVTTVNDDGRCTEDWFKGSDEMADMFTILNEVFHVFGRDYEVEYLSKK